MYLLRAILAVLFISPSILWASDTPVPSVQSSSTKTAANQDGIGALGRDVSCQLKHPEKGYAITQAVEIIDVQEGGGAYNKGLRSGDLLITVNGQAVGTCAEVGKQIALIHDDSQIVLELLRGQELITVEAERRSYKPADPASDEALKKASELFERQKANRPVSLSDDHRALVSTYAKEIKLQLAAAPEGTNARAIISDMQKIRNVFRDSNPQSDGWMKGNAGEATIQFKRGEYILILKGMNNQLTLEVYNNSGNLLYSTSMDTLEQRSQIPSFVLQLLRSF